MVSKCVNAHAHIGFNDRTQPKFARITKSECGVLCSDLCARVATLTHLTYDFVQDVLHGATESSAQARELLDELEVSVPANNIIPVQTKWRQFVLELDVELTQSERTVRANLDKCRISDHVCNVYMQQR